MKRLSMIIICLLVLCNFVGCYSDVLQAYSEENSENQQTYSEVESEVTVTTVEESTDSFEFETKNDVKQTETTEPEEIFYPQKEDALIKSLDFDSEDAMCLEKIAYAEAGGESIECMALVMLVVLNRTWSSEFPNSIEAVITQDGQFTPCSNGSYYSAEPNEDTHEALDLILHGWNESQNALYFESCNGDSWHSKNLEYLYSSGNMRFYK